MVGAMIKQYLSEHGIKQTYLAQSTGLTDQMISDICNNDRKIDCVEYYKICKALNLPLEYFLAEM
jgi:transcriptional regulator with XRE-family HTH domain